MYAYFIVCVEAVEAVTNVIEIPKKQFSVVANSLTSCIKKVVLCTLL